MSTGRSVLVLATRLYPRALRPWILACGGILGGALSAAAQSTSTPAQHVSINFALVAGTRPVTCGASYDGFAGGRTLTFSDARLYVHDLRLVRKDGTTAPIALDQDGLWQYRNVALLDFENGDGACSNGTPDTRYTVEGTVPPGEYVGLRFVVGVPFDLNHLDLAKASSPLTLTRMYWSWNLGYIFMRIEFAVAGARDGFFHLGSMKCSSRGATTPPRQCDAPNRPSIDLPAFDARTDVVQLDVIPLLAAALSSTPPAQCMSEDSATCESMFRSLGLSQGAAPAPRQVVFRVARSDAAGRKSP